MDDKEIDAILHEEEDFFPIDLATEQVENICGNPEDVSPPPELFDDVPQLQGDDYPQEFLRMVDMIHHYYRLMPQVDYQSTMAELSTLTVENIPTPTLQLINQQLQRVQAVKERVSEIMREILPAHAMKKRYLDLLQDSWGKFASGKSADIRKADAIFRFYQFDADLTATDGLMKAATHVAKNLDSLQEILSRRITIVSLELKMHELGRTSMPGYEFTGPSLGVEVPDIEGNIQGNSIGTLVVNTKETTDEVLEADELQF